MPGKKRSRGPVCFARTTCVKRGVKVCIWGLGFVPTTHWSGFFCLETRKMNQHPPKKRVNSPEKALMMDTEESAKASKRSWKSDELDDLPKRLRLGSETTTYSATESESSSEYGNRSLSACHIAMFFSLDCERFLWLQSLQRNTQIKKKYVSSTYLEHSRQVRLERGNKFEGALCDRLQGFQHLKAINLKNKQNEAVQSSLVDVGEGSVLLSLSMVLDPNHEWVGELNNVGVTFSKAETDFIFVDISACGKFLDLLIVDAKSSKAVKLAHLAQVAIYIECMELYLIENNINSIRQKGGTLPLRVVSTGGIWSPASSNETVELVGHGWKLADGPEIHDLSVVREKVRSFLFKDLPEIFGKDLDQVPWYLTAGCQNCKFVRHCRQETRNGKLISHVPYLSKPDNIWLTNLPRASGEGKCSTVLDIEDLLASQDPKIKQRVNRILSAPEGLQGKSVVHRATLPKGFTTQSGEQKQYYSVEVKPGISSISFPKDDSGEHRYLVLSLLAEQACLEQRIVSWALREIIYETTWTDKRVNYTETTSTQDTYTIRNSELQEYNACEEKLIESLYSLFVKYSENTEIHFKQRLGVLFFDQSEAQLFSNVVVKQALNNSRLWEKAILVALTCGGGEALLNLQKTKDTTLTKVKKRKLLIEQAREAYERLPQEFRTRFEDAFNNCGKYWTKKGDLKKDGYIAGLYIHEMLDELVSVNLSPDNESMPLTEVETLYKQVKDEQKQSVLGPRVIILSDFVIKHFVLPVPGFYTFSDTILRSILTSTDREANRVEVRKMDKDQLYEQWVVLQERKEQFQRLMDRRTYWIWEASKNYRRKFFQCRTQYPEELKPSLLRYIPKFLFCKELNIKNPQLNKLAFIDQYETIRGCKEQNEQRVNRSLEEQVVEGSVLRLVFTGSIEDAFKRDDNGKPVGRPLSGEKVLNFTGITGDDKFFFKPWLIVIEDQKGLEQARCFQDYMRMNDTYGKKLAGIWKVNGDGTIKVQTTQFKLGWKSFFPDESYTNKEFLLFKRKVDMFLLQKSVKNYQTIDKKLSEGDTTASLFLDIINNPEGWNTPNRSLMESTSQRLYIEQNKFALRESQLAALRDGVLEKRLQCIWGPPGAGKTYFLGCLVSTLVVLFKLAKKPLRVLVTASTNSAIDTCLESIAKQLDRQDATEDAEKKSEGKTQLVQLGGVMRTKSPHKKVQLLLAEDFTSNYVKQYESLIVGSTVWSLCKTSYELNNSFGEPFNVVIIDEGSQMTVGNASIAIRYLSKETGRLIVAGDHKQLPPIINGNYPPPNSGEPRLHGSILECLIRDMSSSRCFKPFENINLTIESSRIARLNENFRMNRVLAKFTHFVYGDSYNEVPEHANELLTLSDQGSDCGNMISTVLDPVYQQVAIMIPAKHNTCNEEAAEAEAKIVCKIIEEFKARSLDTAEDWHKKVLIVTPHHVQRRAVTRCLKAKLGEEHVNKLFINTAEKAQGKTSDFVILCYGVLCKNQVARDASFIYNPNRLNVALTRSRWKWVILVGEPLIHTSLINLDSPMSREGYALLKHATQSEGTTHVSLRG